MTTRSDLVAMVADLDAEQTVSSLLRRHQALGIQPLTFKVIRYAMRDSGCRKDAASFLRDYLSDFHHALVVFDHHGSGRDDEPRSTVEGELEAELCANGWGDRAAAVVISPELEAWVFGLSPKVQHLLGWQDPALTIREFLFRKGFLLDLMHGKPPDPKSALSAILRRTGKPASAKLFAQLAGQVSFRSCTDPSFTKLRERLRTWFGT